MVPSAPSTRTSPPRRSRLPAPALLAALTLFVFVNYLDRYALSVLLEHIKRDLSLSDTQIGLLTGAAFALLYSTLALPVARYAERHDRVRILIAAVMTWSLGTALCGLAGGFAGLFAARMLVGSGEAGALAPAHAIIGDRYPIERRGTAFAIFSAGGALGTAVAPLVGGLLEKGFGWRGCFLALGLAGIPVALLLALLAKDPPRTAAAGAGPAAAVPSLGIAFRRLARRPSFVLLIPATALLGLGEYSLILWLPSYFARTFGESSVRVGAMLTIYQGIPMLLGTLFGGVAADRLIARDRRWLLRLPAVTCAFVAFGSMLLLLVHDRLAAQWLLVPLSLACGIYLAPTYAAIQALAGARSRATATAALTFSVNLLGLGLGPVLIGGASDLLGRYFGADSLRYALLVVSPFYLLASGMFAVAIRFILADMADAESEGPVSDLSD